MRMKGRRIAIVGGASGIGLATARVLHREGAAVALFDLNAQMLDAAVDELRSEQSEAALAAQPITGVCVDVRDRPGLDAGFKLAASICNGLDGLVISAGIDCLAPFDSMTFEQWRDVLDVNLTGPFHCCQASLPYLRAAGGGTIVHIASGAALRPLASRTAYCASKAGLVMFAKTLAVDLAADHIRVNAVCPGIIETPLFRESLNGAENPEAELERIFDRYLIRQVGNPEDIANAVLYLSCGESAHVTGSSLAVDGGRAFH